MKRGSIKTFFILACALFSLFSLHPPAHASTDEDKQTLEMFFDQKDIAVVATKARPDVSHVAENLTIVTAREIEARTPTPWPMCSKPFPVSRSNIGGPGSLTDTSINGSSVRQFLVVIDGVQLNNFSDNVVNTGSIPVQNVSRIEIIKGPASSSWGPALGGVINIVNQGPG